MSALVFTRMLPIGRLRRGHTRVGRAAVAAAALSLTFIVRGGLHVPIEGSVALFLAGAALHLFATTSMGIFMATHAPDSGKAQIKPPGKAKRQRSET
ncbi:MULTISPECIES: hypothetical protein [unclassified Paraburkholderia]|uniref:hypothetical protein n=1 Tax=unclassified Paraburkholderia TaxID=2615204 RepID=UPI00161C515C|nr:MULTISPECIES: hypothetical protein [unclassified Paraburkholderia]MBB5448112.1 ABC-2 type transport system permease protein [Paraburkholderia sp. WSM4177]MBB5488502.1 ABC-2 type transport system permease protein [Paraburkholderia sp. WSM4180]